MAFLDHRELKIIKGIGPIPGDANSAEQTPVVVNLMDPNGGIALDGTNGAWSPQIPSVKPLWAENPANDGRTLIAGALNNVTETMRLTITGSDATTVYSNLRRLYDIRQAALDFWQTEDQIEPVYLKWWANCGVGPQFALIYTMDVAPEFMNSEMPTIQVTLTIEREFGWRGIPPGANPKMWTLGTGFNVTTAPLVSRTDNLIYATAQNRNEWNAANTAFISKNFVTIPKAKIPGDLPAYTLITPENIYPFDQIVLGLDTDPVSLPNASGTNIHKLVLNAGDATVGTDTTKVVDAADGVYSNGSIAQRYRTNTTFATATLQPRLTWDISQLLYNGRFLAFLRCRLSAAASLSLELHSANIALTQPTPFSTFVGAGFTDWSLVYLGLVVYPQMNSKAFVTVDGRGVNYLATGDITLFASRASGAGLLYVLDLVLIPVNEGAIQTNLGISGSSGLNPVFDNTGYFTHGTTDSYVGYSGGFTTSIPSPSGSPLMLKPGVDNRLHMLGYSLFAPPFQSYPNDKAHPAEFNVHIDIVPRWSGIRDA